MTFDELDEVLRRCLASVQDDLKYAIKDETYFNRETLIKVCKLRDALSVASTTASELNESIG